MTTNAFPSISNIHGGKALTEANLRRGPLGDYNHAVVGLTIQDSSGTLIVNGGEAFIGGRRVWIDGLEPPQWPAGTIGANVTRYIHLKTVEDGSGNLASVSFTVDTSPLWITGSGPTAHYLCLGRVKTNTGGTAFTEVVNAVHFPRLGRGFAGRVALTTTQTTSVSANADKTTNLVIPKFMAPRDCVMEFSGIMCVQHTSSTAGMYARLVDDAARTTILWSAVGHNGSDQYVPMPLSGSIFLAAGQVISPRIMQRSNVAGSLVIAGGYANLTAFLSDRY